MNRVLLVCLMLACPTLAYSQSSDAGESPTTTIEELVVNGEQPGPGLWKVTKGDHTLWVLAVASPLPKKMTWRSKQVEELIAQSEIVIAPGEVKRDIDIGFFQGVKMIPAVLRLIKNPNDTVLADVLTPEVYAKWQALSQKYMGTHAKGFESYRPIYVIARLRDFAFKEADLSNVKVVEPTVRALAKKHHVKYLAPVIEVEIKVKRASKSLDNVTKSLDEIPKIAADEHECFAKMLDHIEPDLRVMKSRANSWAVGDVAGLLDAYRAPLSTDCIPEIRAAISAMDDSEDNEAIKANWKKTAEAFDRANKDIRQKWLEAAELALTSKKTSFAMLSIYDVLYPQGRLAELRSKGYVVEPPKQ